MATGCSRAASASTMAPSTWASRWCRSRRATPCARSCCPRPSRPSALRLRRAPPPARPSRRPFPLHIGESLREQGGDPAALGLRYGLFGAEPWTEAMRARLQSLWGCPAVDFYGLSEVIGPGVASECVEARDGLHLNEDHFLPEIVGPASGVPLPGGGGGGAGRPALPQAPPTTALLPRPSSPARPGGPPLRAGRGGELVLTSLTKEALPVIRYR